MCVLYMQDGDNINNYMTVLPRDADDNAVRERLLSPTGVCISEDRRYNSFLVVPWPRVCTASQQMLLRGLQLGLGHCLVWEEPL